MSLAVPTSQKGVSMAQNILVISDDEDVVSRMMRTIDRPGTQVVSSTDEPPILLIIDTNIRKLNSSVPGILEQVKRNFPVRSIPLFVLGEPNDQGNRYLAGFSKPLYLRRPFSTELLLSELRKQLPNDPVICA